MATMVTWLARFALATVGLSLWLLFVVVLLADLSREKGIPVFVIDEEEFTHGLATTHSLHGVLGAITVAYCLALLPLLLFPFSDQERFEGFRAVAYGWVLCLLGSTAFLAVKGWIGMIDAPFPLDGGQVVLLMAFSLLLVGAASFAFPIAGARRWIGIGLLFAGGAALALALARIERVGAEGAVPPWFSPHFSGQRRIATLLLGFLWAMVIASLVWPAPSARRIEVFGFLLLAWLFSLAAILGHEINLRRIRIIDEDFGDWRGWDTFACVTVSLFLTPIFLCLGTPATRAQRLAWLACLGLAALVVLTAALTLSLPGTSGGVLYHVWRGYDGPRWNAW